MIESGMGLFTRLAVAYCAILLVLAGLAGLFTSAFLALLWQEVRSRVPSSRASASVHADQLESVGDARAHSY